MTEEEAEQQARIIALFCNTIGDETNVTREDAARITCAWLATWGETAPLEIERHPLRLRLRRRLRMGRND